MTEDAEQHFTCDTQGECVPTEGIYAAWNPLAEELEDNVQRREDAARAALARDDRRREEVISDILAYTIGERNKAVRPRDLNDFPWVPCGVCEANTTGSVTFASGKSHKHG